MTRIVRLPRPPFPKNLLDELRDSGPVYHPDPAQDGFRALLDAGVDARAVEGFIPEGAVLLLPVATGELEALVQIVDRLLAPDGCPWDREQTHRSLRRYLIEESYELCAAIDSESVDALREELGDVLLQPLLHAAMQSRDGGFDIDDVAGELSEKLLRRHPHVFGDVEANDSETVLQNWDAIKRAEKGAEPGSILDGVPRSMPALLRAFEVSKRAARAGFEWPDLAGVWEKADEERRELEEAVASGASERVEEELGDLLFTIVNVARWLKIEPESALSAMIDRFAKRFKAMETSATRPLSELDPQQWDAAWEGAKARS